MAGEWGDLVSYDFDQPQVDWENYDTGAADMGGYDWQNDMTGMGFGDFGGAPATSGPSYEMTNPGSMWTPPSMSEPAAPTIGQPGPNPREDDWLTQLKKAGTGMGVGLLTQGAGAGLQALMAPGQQKQQAMAQSTTAGRQYTPEPLEDLPGTKASPLISGRPTQVIGSQGLKGKRAPSYGGFSMY